MSEFDFIHWMRGQARFQDNVLIGPGDDAAVLAWDSQSIMAVSTDTILQDIDFVVQTDTLYGIGWKALCISLSDIAAMGLQPTAAVCTMSIPPDVNRQAMEEIHRGLQAASNKYQCPVVGGDLSTAKTGGLSLTSTVFGSDGDHDLQAIRRDGAKVGDIIVVTGALGGSRLGRHLLCQPRVQEAMHLNKIYRLHSMIDISDGLSGDLKHICDESNCAALVQATSIPIHDDAKTLAETSDKTPLCHALHDGEDFELLFTLPASEWQALSTDQTLGISLTAIGEITSGKGILLQQGDRQSPLHPESFQHNIASS